MMRLTRRAQPGLWLRTRHRFSKSGGGCVRISAATECTSPTGFVCHAALEGHRRDLMFDPYACVTLMSHHHVSAHLIVTSLVITYRASESKRWLQ
jgi:hypothetical protein